MITVILCLRPLRVPKFIWFKILHDRRYEFGLEMCADGDPDIIMREAYAVRNFGLMKHFINEIPRYFWEKLFCIKNDIEAIKRCCAEQGQKEHIFKKACRYGRPEVIKELGTNFIPFVVVIGFRSAMKSYHWDIVKYILENFKVDVEHYIFKYGCRKGILEVLDMLLPYSKKRYNDYLDYATERIVNNAAVVNYLKKLN